MFCNVLKLIKLFYLSTAMFRSNSSVYLEKGTNRIVATVSEFNYPRAHFHSEVMVVNDKRYYECLLDIHSNHSVVLTTPQIGFEVWRKPPTPRIPTITIRQSTSNKATRSHPPPLNQETDSDSD